MPNAAGGRTLACSLALLAWAFYPHTATAHAHGHWAGHVHNRAASIATAESWSNDDRPHTSSRADSGLRGSSGRAAAASASTAATGLKAAAWRRRRLHTATDSQHSEASATSDPALAAVPSTAHGAASAMPVHTQLAAAAKADIAAKTLRARKADMYPGSSARRALAEDPNLAVRCTPVTCCHAKSQAMCQVRVDSPALLTVTAMPAIQHICQTRSSTTFRPGQRIVFAATCITGCRAWPWCLNSTCATCRTCGTPEPSHTELRDVYRQLSARAAALGAEASREAGGNTNLTINVHFHVINKGAALDVTPWGLRSCAVTASWLPLVLAPRHVHWLLPMLCHE